MDTRAKRNLRRQVILFPFVWIWIMLALVIFPIPEVSARESKLPFPIPEGPDSLPESAVIETTKGSFEITFYRNEAPIAVRNFEYLGKKGFYNNLSFHKYVPGFAIHGGDPKGTGRGGPGYFLPPEQSSIEHVRGVMGMLRYSDVVDPERRSNGSQFYICLTRAKHLDGIYTIFAKVIHGMENVEKLREGDKILHILFPK